MNIPRNYSWRQGEIFTSVELISDLCCLAEKSPQPVTLLAVFTHCRNHSKRAAKADCGAFFPHQTLKLLNLSTQEVLELLSDSWRVILFTAQFFRLPLSIVVPEHSDVWLEQTGNPRGQGRIRTYQALKYIRYGIG